MTDKPNILLIGEAAPTEGSLRAQIESLGYALERATHPEEALAAVETGRFDAVVIDATAPDVDGFLAAKHIKRMTREKAVPVVFACHASDLRTEVDSREMGADDCFAKPIETEELGARLRLLLRNRALERTLREERRQLKDINAEILRAREMLDRELELAGIIQRSLLPRALPELDRYQFVVALRPSGEVSGDFYDLYRLDEAHYGFYVADAVGHGVPAALLTVFVKMGIETRDVLRDGYRLLPPGEALAALNRSIIEQRFSQNPFVTLAYSILDVRRDELQYASGGHPPAVVLRADGSVVPLASDGPLLGIFESRFATGSYPVQPGDCVVLYTDGVELATFAGKSGLDAVVDYLRALPSDGHEPDSAEARRVCARYIGAALDTLLSPGVDPSRSDDAALLVLKRWR